MQVSAQSTAATGEVDYLTPEEVAARMRISKHFVRKHYLRFGGIRVAGTGVVRIPVDYERHLRAADQPTATAC